MPRFEIIHITKMANLKLIFPFLVFEHGYLIWCKTYTHQIFNMYIEHSDLGKSPEDLYQNFETPFPPNGSQKHV